jgi:hypothetical protein
MYKANSVSLISAPTFHLVSEINVAEEISDIPVIWKKANCNRKPRL